MEKAGISTTGSEIENELKPLAEEFGKYRQQTALWEEKIPKVEYKVIDEEVLRIPFDENGNALPSEKFYN